MAKRDTFFCMMVMIFWKYTTASGKFELQVLKVDNVRNEKTNGECCDSSGARNDRGICTQPCVTSIKVCLKEYQSVTRPSEDDHMDTVCKLGNTTSGVLTAVDLLGNVDHPVVYLVLPFDFAWTVSSFQIFRLVF